RSIPPWSDRYLADIAVITMATGKTRRLTSELRPLGFDVSPDGKYVASLSFAGMESPKAQQPLYDLYLVPLQGEPPRRLAQDVRQDYGVSISWSPDSSYLAYRTHGQLARGDVFVVSIPNGSLQNLTKSVEAKLGHSYERPLWSADGKHLFCAAAGNLWQVSLDSSPARNLTEDFDKRVKGAVHPSERYTIWSPDGGRSVCVQTVDPESKQHGFHQINLTNGKITRLLEESKWYGSFGITRFHMDVADDGKSVAYIAEDATHPEDIWLLDGSFQSRKQITKLNPQLRNVAFGETRLISWQTSKGKRLQGVLLMPTDYVPGQRYPLITRVYGGSSRSNRINHFGLEHAADDNMQLLATCGYAVFMPDAPLEVGNPLQQLAELVLPGIDKVMELDIADAERLGLMGYSYGGYCVNCLITQTTRFRAAVSSAGTSDLVSMYGSPGENGDSRWTGWTESGQGRMGGTLWEFPERYVENSPVFLLDKVETPLLLIHGVEDVVPIAQAEEMFSGLRRLGKRVSLVRYSDTGHGYWSYDNVVDYWKRIIAWFDEHL
ncbi:prolyl oligopeptidase family serine peptidase, partial [Candidatus Poribacteria bacterium]